MQLLQTLPSDRPLRHLLIHPCPYRDLIHPCAIARDSRRRSEVQDLGGIISLSITEYPIDKYYGILYNR